MSTEFGGVPHAADAAVHAEIVALEDAWSAAIVSNDAAAIASFIVDEWVIVSESGIASKDDLLAFVASGDLTHSAMDRISEPRVQLYGDTAIYSARVTNTAHYRGQRFDADEWTTDVYVRRGDRWLCVLSQITAAKAQDEAASDGS